MEIWIVVGAIAIAGAVGGVVNALMTDNGFILPKAVTSDGMTIVRAGVIGNVIIGAVAAAVSWGLYGPLAAALVIGQPPAGATPVPVSLAISTLFTAVLIGIGGARWLTSEIDKRLLRAAAAEAAGAQPDDATARQIAVALPAEALRLATSMPNR